MKIAHIIYSFPTGGTQSLLIDILNLQVKQADVSLIIINKLYNDKLLNEIDKKVKIYFINRKEGSKNPFPIIELNILLLKLNSSILHCHNHNIIPLVLPLLRRNALLTLHCMDIPTKYLKKYSKVFAISETVRTDIMTRGKINSTVIYNGISIDRIQSKDNLIFRNIFKIICVGRLEHMTKGQHIAIEALHLLKHKGISNIQLDFIGSGTSLEFLKELTFKFKLENQVNYLGLKDREYIYMHLKDYDLLLQPSISEGFGLTVVEGIIAGLAVLVSDIDGPKEIIDKTGFGFTFKTESATACANEIFKIFTAFNTPDFFLKQQQQQIQCKELFDIANTSKMYIKEYQNLI